MAELRKDNRNEGERILIIRSALDGGYTVETGDALFGDRNASYYFLFAGSLHQCLDYINVKMAKYIDPTAPIQ